MSVVADTIRKFGNGMGIEGLTLNERGMLGLTFESKGSLFLERTEASMLVYFARDIPPYETGILPKALQLCHYRQGLPFTVNAGLARQNQLIFLIRMPEQDFSLPSLEKAVELLLQLHKKVS